MRLAGKVFGESGKENTMQKITDNVYVETGYNGCNVSFVVTGEGVVMVDSPMVPAEAARWRDTIAGYG